MTPPAFAEPVGDRLPTPDDRRAADRLRRLIAQHAASDATLKVIDDDAREPVEITLTPGMSVLLLDLLRQIGSGHAVTLVPIREMLTTQQAADILSVSRPYLIGLLDKSVLPHTFTGRHRRVRADDVFAYKAKRDAERAAALKDVFKNDADPPVEVRQPLPRACRRLLARDADHAHHGFVSPYHAAASAAGSSRCSTKPSTPSAARATSTRCAWCVNSST